MEPIATPRTSPQYSPYWASPNTNVNMSVSRSTNINSLITVNISDIVPFPIPALNH